MLDINYQTSGVAVFLYTFMLLSIFGVMIYMGIDHFILMDIAHDEVIQLKQQQRELEKNTNTGK